jgi:non-specific serine/threonine protein kinase
MFENDLDQANWLLEESAELYRQLGIAIALGGVLGNLGAVAVSSSEYERAAVYFAESLRIARETDDAELIALKLSMFAGLEVKRGDIERARALLVEAMRLDSAIMEPRKVAQNLEICAWLAATQGQSARTARLLGAIASLRESIGVPVFPMAQADYDRYVPIAKSRIDSATWERAWSEGRLMTLDEAIADALDLLQSPAESPASTNATLARAGLSKREMDVVRLLVEGRTNQEIAATLFISPHTTANHVASILNKLGLDSRTAVVAWTVREGIA